MHTGHGTRVKPTQRTTLEWPSRRLSAGHQPEPRARGGQDADGGGGGGGLPGTFSLRTALSAAYERHRDDLKDNAEDGAQMLRPASALRCAQAQGLWPPQRAGCPERGRGLAAFRPGSPPSCTGPSAYCRAFADEPAGGVGGHGAGAPILAGPVFAAVDDGLAAAPWGRERV